MILHKWSLIHCFGFLFMPSHFSFFSTNISKVLEALGASGRIFYLLERTPAIPKDTLVSTQKPEHMEGRIEFQQVNFQYPSRPDVPVLSNYSLTVPANTTAALVGPSGAGKSTVVALLQRFYDTSSGTIQIDGMDLQKYNLQYLRRHIGYVQQEPTLMGLSIKENVLYGVENPETISQDQLEQVCKDANAHDFITQWPDGYETLVGERGVTLSGGQKQRIAIARALLCEPRILLLDEATSALDAESEYWVQDAIQKATVGRTVIIVAHRLSTIQQASQIVVMDTEGVVDVGTHSVLLQRCSKYQELIQRQSMVATASSSDGLLTSSEFRQLKEIDEEESAKAEPTGEGE